MKSCTINKDLIQQIFLSIPLLLGIVIYPLCFHTDVYLWNITMVFVNIFLLTIIFVCFKRKKISINLLDILFLLFSIWYLTVYWLNTSTMDEWKIVQFVSCCFLYFYCKVYISLYFVLVCLLCSGIIQAVWSFLQIATILPSYHYLLIGTGSFPNPAILGIFLVLSFFSGVVLYNWHSSRSYRYFVGILLVILLIGIAFSNSRASWFALVIGCCGLIINSKWDGKLLYRHVITIIIGIVCIGILLYILYKIRPDSVQGRWLVWQVIGNHISEHPFLGHGELAKQYMFLQAEWFRSYPNSPLAQFAGNTIFAFNEYLRVLFEAGIWGFVLLLCLLIVLWRYVQKGSLCCKNLVPLIIALMTFSLFSYPFEIPVLIIVGIVFVSLVSKYAQPKYTWTFKLDCWQQLGRLFVVISLFVYTLQIYIPAKKADILLKKAAYNVQVLTGKQIKNYYNLFQGNADFVISYGTFLYDRELYMEALPILENACQLRPLSGFVDRLGWCYQEAKQYKKAEKCYQEASLMVPAYILPHYRLFCLYKEMGELEKAKEKAEYLINMSVKVVNSSVLRFRNQAKIFLEEYSD